jgi:hypothetical protein
MTGVLCCMGRAGVSIKRRRSPAQWTNTEPYLALPSACHPSAARRSIVVAMAPDRSQAGGQALAVDDFPLRSE